MEEYSPNVSEVVRYFQLHPLPHQGPPMLYQPLGDLDISRLPDVIEGIQDPDDMFSESQGGGRNVTCSGRTKEQEHTAVVMRGLLYLMVGGTDETHDLVLPYSLPCDTDWGGPAILDSPALGSATYAHALVHRSEGKFIGELGMIGWDNARSWFSETPQDHPMFSKASCVTEATEQSYNLSEDDKLHCKKVKQNDAWNWRTMMDLFSSCDKSSGLTEFCNELHNREIMLLFQHCNVIVNKPS